MHIGVEDVAGDTTASNFATDRLNASMALFARLDGGDIHVGTFF